MPDCWSELPEKIWLKVCSYSAVKDINNLHLVCKLIHNKLADSHVYQKFQFDKEFFEKLLLNPTLPLRNFQKIFLIENNVLLQKNYKHVENFIKYTGDHVRKLKITSSVVDPKILMKLLISMPNLKFLILERLAAINKESIEWKFQLSKLESVKMFCCAPNIESMLTSLAKSKIKDLDLTISSSNEDKTLFLKFLKSQEESLKKLKIICTKHDLLNNNDLKLELEDLDIDMDFLAFPLIFLKEHIGLKTLKMRLPNFDDVNLNLIFGLENLEDLNLVSGTEPGQTDNLNGLYRLKKLRKLHVQGEAENILEVLKFGVQESLEDLYGYFENIDLESIQNMKRITPNLKKLNVSIIDDSTLINVFLKTLDKLEAFGVYSYTWEFPTFVLPKIKSLQVIKMIFDIDYAEKMIGTFPNLEHIAIQDFSLVFNEPIFELLLEELKQLKELHFGFIQFENMELNKESILQIVAKFGKNMKKIIIAGNLNHLKRDEREDIDDNIEKYNVNGVQVVFEIQQRDF
jgi:hypothetical protein